MNPQKTHWVMDVVIGQAKNLNGFPREPFNKEQWDHARTDVKTHAARILAALQKDYMLTHEDYLEYYEANKGAPRG